MGDPVTLMDQASERADGHRTDRDALAPRFGKRRLDLNCVRIRRDGSNGKDERDGLGAEAPGGEGEGGGARGIAPLGVVEGDQQRGPRSGGPEDIEDGQSDEARLGSHGRLGRSARGPSRVLEREPEA